MPRPRGFYHSEETKRKISESIKRVYVKNPELKKSVSKHHKGKFVSDETRRKISEANKGVIKHNKPHSEESKKKMSESHKKLHKHLSEEEKLKLSLFHKGKQHSLGNKHSEETRKKISEANKGRKREPLSEKTKRRMSLAKKNYIKAHPEIYEKLTKQLLNRVIQYPSKPERKLFDIIKSMFPNKEVKTNYLVKTKEGNRFIDVAVPELRLGFEYDEPYWHQDVEKDIKRHQLIENEGWKLKHYTSETEFPKKYKY